LLDNNGKFLVKSFALHIKDLSHTYNKSKNTKLILDSINLNIKRGELLGLLGPSGCGKTTLLRLIAGFESPTKGSIYLNQEEISSKQKILSPEKRNIGMVFQDYALFPHLNVFENAIFGLKNKNDSSRVDYLLNILEIDSLKNRYPHELSGGQKQRLAIARALAPGTSFLLLDEPFCSLDLNVRLKLRSELPNILKSLGASGMLVTHDPEEAMAICDKVAVMNDGYIHQSDEPSKLINNPKTLFVSKFILGSNNLKIKHDNNFVFSCLGEIKLSNFSNDFEFKFISVPPKSIELESSNKGKGYVCSKEFLGEFYIYKISLGTEEVRVRTTLNKDLKIGQRCNVFPKMNSDFFIYPGGYKDTFS